MPWLCLHLARRSSVAVEDDVNEVIQQIAQLPGLGLVGQGLGPAAILVDELLGPGEHLSPAKQPTDAPIRTLPSRSMRSGVAADWAARA